MIFTETELAGAFTIDLEPHADERGFFARAWCENEFERPPSRAAALTAATVYS